jgi:hypothetical protein
VSKLALDRLEILPAANEPELAPVQRKQALPLTVNLSGGQPTVESREGRPALDFPNATPVLRALAPVTTDLTAGEVADAMKSRCARCLHFRNEDWRTTKKLWERCEPGSSRKVGLSKMVMQYARSVLDRAPDPADLARSSYEMNTWGTCAALSEFRHDLVIVHPIATCPDGLDFYQDRGRAEKVEASHDYDVIMRAAQGRKG